MSNEIEFIRTMGQALVSEGSARGYELLNCAERMTAAQAALSTLPDAVAGERWQPIETAPYVTPVRIEVGEMTFLARLVQDASMDENERSCDQWVAEREGEHPPCWTDGACWASNSDEMMSMQPTRWQRAEVQI